MNLTQLEQIITALSEIDSLSDNSRRNTVYSILPKEIRNTWTRDNALRFDLVNLWKASIAQPNGVEDLFKAIEFYEGKQSVPLRHAKELWQRASAQQALLNLLEGNLPEESVLRELYSESLPAGRVMGVPIRSIDDMLIDLNALTEGQAKLHPVLAFAERLSRHLTTNEANEQLHQWVNDALQSIYTDSDSKQLALLRDQLSQGAQKLATDQTGMAYVLIELVAQSKPVQNQNQAKYGCIIDFWDTSGKRRQWQSSNQRADESWTFAELPEILADIFKRNLAPEKMIIAFLLPDELLSCDVDQWDDKVLLTEGIKVGMSHPVVVRPLARMKDPYYRQRCFNRWQLIRQQLNRSPQEHLLWICGDDWNAVDLVLDLKEANDIFCVGLTFMPPIEDDDTILDIMLDTGLPIALWPRLDGEVIGSHEKVKAVLRQWLDIDAFEKVPETIRRIRRYARTKAEYQIGKHLTLVWDDPTRIPAKYDDEKLMEPEMR